VAYRHADPRPVSIRPGPARTAEERCSPAIALAVTRVRRAFSERGWGRRLERVTGSVMIGLGLRLALESR
jgi:hypothetical protein